MEAARKPHKDAWSDHRPDGRTNVVPLDRARRSRVVQLEPVEPAGREAGKPSRRSRAPRRHRTRRSKGDAAPAAGAPAKKRSPARLLLPIGALLLLGVGGWYGYQWWTTGRFMVSTDDAYVQADATTLAAKVAGYVASVDVADNGA